MACGVPVIVANNSSIPEIVGNAALLFDAQDVRGMSDSMCKILTDETVSAMLSKSGVERAASFSWEKCARETVEVYKGVVEHRIVGLK
jgi:alpha-1,3-rhamnosyl/mannosyltransferase